jgi:hypothetical protein
MKGKILMVFDAEILQDVTVNVCQAVLGLPLESVAESAVPDDLSTTLMASVRIQGDWHGELRVVCGAPLARLLAGTMFGCHGGDLTAMETTDAVGEIANIIGGNLKGALGLECTLSLPYVRENLSFPTPWQESSPKRSASFLCGGHRLTVLVMDTPVCHEYAI